MIRKQKPVAYRVIQEKMYIDHVGWKDTFGIEAFEKIDPERIIYRVSDLSTRRQPVCDLAGKMNRFSLSYIHIYDLVSDWIILGSF